jgi:hypothetical protein
VRIPSLELKSSVHKLEDAIITLSGPALAISGIIAGVDLLTGGTLMRTVSWLVFAWAIFLLISLDFQVLALGARAHKVYQSNKPYVQRILEITLAFVLAAAISYVSVQMQSIIAGSNSVGISVEAATVQLGINPIALTWERSALVLLLIFLSGWFREEKSETGAKEGECPGENTPVDETIAICEEQPAMPLLTSESRAKEDESMANPIVSNSERVRMYLAAHPTAKAPEVAAALSISTSTAYKWIQKVRQP